MDKQDLLFEGRRVTDDTLFEGDLKCLQFNDGYRFSVDAVLAAHFCAPAAGSEILDIGTGCGIIGLIMMYRWEGKIKSLSALEVQPHLRKLAEQNFFINGYSGKCSVQQGNIRDALKFYKPESFSQVICTPPFYTLASGRQSGNEEARLARHQVTAELSDFAKGSAALVKNQGKVVFIFPAESSIQLFTVLTEWRLTVKRIRFIYSYPGEEQSARLVLVECRKNGRPGTAITAPFYIYSSRNGQYSKEMQELYAAAADT